MPQKYYEELLDVIESNKSDIRVICGNVWSLVKDKPDREGKRVFTAFLRDLDLYDVELENIQTEFEETDPKFESVRALEKRIVGSLIDLNPCEEDFYSQLWTKINDPILFPEQSSQVSFLTCLWSDACIPYYQLGEGCMMEDEQYRSLLEELSPYLKKANFILSTNLKQRTQRASLLMDIAEEIDEKEKKVAFWAYAISRASSQINPDQIAIIKRALAAGLLPDDSDEKD